MNIAKSREKTAQNFGETLQFGGLDPGHVPNHIGQDKIVCKKIRKFCENRSTFAN
jgi:hypothetical protein